MSPTRACRSIATFRERHALPPQRAERTGKAKRGSSASGSGAGASGFPIGVSIMGHPAHADAAQKLEGVLHCVREALPLADFIEVNESCPNVHHGRRGGHSILATRPLQTPRALGARHPPPTHPSPTEPGPEPSARPPPPCAGVGSGGAGATDELAARLRAIVAVRDAAARAPGGRRVPVLVKLGDLGDAKATVRFLARLGVDGVVSRASKS